MSTDMGNLAGGCSCSWEDNGTSAIYERTIRKARKAHRCVECSDAIMPGTIYEHVDSLCEGYWSHFKTCAPCMYIMSDMGCVPHGGLREAFWEMFGWNYCDDPADWTE
ncbi:hypothetical protein DRQ25_05260 [Candidatus Fermentibacteria bacterium]|nr:MAG: hypothetical protein DRQ25_05260 [Candidatus Fermentibacteria bacterium]